MPNKITTALTIAALTARLERLESERAADAKVVSDAKRHVGALCRQARRILADNKRLRIEAAKAYQPPTIADYQQAAQFMSEPISITLTTNPDDTESWRWSDERQHYERNSAVSGTSTVSVGFTGALVSKYPVGGAVHLNRWAEPGPRAAENAGWVVEGVFGNGSYLLKHIDGGTTNASDSDIAYQVKVGMALTDTPPWAKYTGLCRDCGAAWAGDSPTCPSCRP